MKRNLHPAVLLVPLLFLAAWCFWTYFSSRPMQFAGSVQNAAPTITPSGQSVFVEKVVDGDTIAALIDGRKTTVRFIGVNAPETYQGKNPECFAEASYQFVKNRIEGKTVSLVADDTQENKDKYERLLRYILLSDGTNLNLELVQKGYAREYTYKIPYTFQKEFKEAEIIAKRDNAGIWGRCN